ncbi:hypothetical protein GGS26DRAFT_593756 [Hypomontagnella submonticulosa]|nr:hypothetical protein GGS26DRAFT_593756 [Hypomontagnella submonticulosa]
MCRKVTCGTCDKTTWVGCGQHIPSVMDNVAPEDWCICKPKVEVDGKEYPPTTKAPK